LQQVDTERELRADSQVFRCAATCTCITLSATVVCLAVVPGRVDTLVFYAKQNRKMTSRKQQLAIV